MSFPPSAQAKVGVFDAPGLLQVLQGEKINRIFIIIFFLIQYS